MIKADSNLFLRGVDFAVETFVVKGNVQLIGTGMDDFGVDEV
jgi:hypothetical protein